MSVLRDRDRGYDADCTDSPPSSAASEDVVDMCEPELSLGRLKDAVQVLLHGIGEDAAREGLRDTPRRVAKAWVEATEGYRQEVQNVLGGALFHERIASSRDSSMVVVQDVEFASTSEANLLPFYGRCHLAYIPRQGVVLGLSKVARLAKMYARRVQNQERFTKQLLGAFKAEVQPLGCAAIVEACHLGNFSRESYVTCAALGCFHEQPDIFMQEFAELLGRPEVLPATSLGNTADGTQSASVSYASDTLPVTSLTNLAQQHQIEGMEAAVEVILREVGENPEREGLRGTARRYVEHLLASTSGLAIRPVQPFAYPSSPPAAALSNGWSSAEDICLTFTSQCEHHLLPFYGMMHILCLPSPGGVRLTQALLQPILHSFSRRLQIQERLTHQVADAVQGCTQAAGVLVLCRAAHMCMVARGVEKHASSTVTVAVRGAFQLDPTLRLKMLRTLKRQHAADAGAVLG